MYIFAYENYEWPNMRWGNINFKIKLNFSKLNNFLDMHPHTTYLLGRLSGKYKKFEKSCSSRLISFFGQNGTKNH